MNLLHQGPLLLNGLLLLEAPMLIPLLFSSSFFTPLLSPPFSPSLPLSSPLLPSASDQDTRGPPARGPLDRGAPDRGPERPPLKPALASNMEFSEVHITMPEILIDFI